MGTSTMARSPQPRSRTGTPAGGESEGAKRARLSHNASATDKQAAALEKLLADPDKPVHIPQGSRERGIRPPKDMIRNVQGSSAGAGSGEFHVYKESRRREYERLKLMDEADAKKRAELEALERQMKFAEEAEAKTAKNRAKRQRKRAAKGGKGPKKDEDADSGPEGGPSQAAADADDPASKRRKVMFKSAEEREGDEDDDDDEQQQHASFGLSAGADVPSRRDYGTDLASAPVAPEAGISIRDED